MLTMANGTVDTGEIKISPSNYSKSETPYMCSMLSRKRQGKRLTDILILLVRDSSNWEGRLLKKITVNSSGNVFVDLGFPQDEAVILQMRSDLMIDLRKFVKSKGLTNAQAALILGLSQSRVSDLLNGKWEKFSLEMLITLATRAGMRVSINLAA
jgi:predicted XRE-type DNA-binding protein